MPHRVPHRPASRRPEPAASFCRLLVGVTVLATPFVGGCSMSFPMASMLPASDDVTGSLSKIPFGAMLDEEDRRREKAALATALDPQGDGSAVHWENPKTKNSGSLRAMAQAYPQDGKVCRVFEATVKVGTTQRTTQNIACAVAAGEWVINLESGKPAKVVSRS